MGNFIPSMFLRWPNTQVQNLCSSNRHSVFPNLIAVLTVDGGLVDAERLTEEGTPIGRYPGITLRNAHFQYIVTWYALKFLVRLTGGIHLPLWRVGCVISCFGGPERHMRSGYWMRGLSEGMHQEVWGDGHRFGTSTRKLLGVCGL